MAFVTLVRPPTVVARWAHTTPTCPPIGLAYVASALRSAGHTVHVVDGVGDAITTFRALDERFLVHGLTADEIAARIPPHADVIGLSCMFSHEWPLMRGVIEALRRRCPRSVIVAGGEHITAMPDFSLADCPALDYCVLGEGEETAAALVDALAGGTPVSGVPGVVSRAADARSTTSRARIKRIDDIVEPAWDLFPLREYLDRELGFGVNRGRSMPVLATRGCPYQCTFCSNPSMWTTRWIARDPARLLEEMKGYIRDYAVDNFDFYDLTAIVKREWIVAFCRLIFDSGLTFTWQLPSGTRSEALDAEVCELLYASGCRNISYAPESGSPAVLRRIKKKIDLERMTRSMRAAVRSGINVKANIILGFPGETHREVWRTLTFMVRMAVVGVHDASISPFSPYPGSELFDELRRSGRIARFSDDYFYSLASYTDLVRTVSVNDRMSARWLALYRVFGMLLFYAVSYGTRPWRLVRTVVNVFRRRQESRLEMSLRDLVLRLRHSSRAREGVRLGG